MKHTIFTLASARSGTLYLKSLFQKNIPGCACRHEPFFDWGNPTMFGRAIYDAHAGRVSRVRQLLEQKRTYIERLPGAWYIESSHAFLKSAYVAALDVFPDLRLIHLIRDPVKVARSEAYREYWRARLHVPFHYYMAEDGRRHFVWALTGNEEIYRLFAARRLTLFQWYFLQWIEIENRAARFLADHQLQSRCFTLETSELNEPAKVRDMFDFFGLRPFSPQLRIAGRKNQSLGYTAADDARQESECCALLERLPETWLELFSRPPYSAYSWSKRFQPARKRAPAIRA